MGLGNGTFARCGPFISRFQEVRRYPRWSTRQLERQIAALLYERLAKSRTPDKVLALARDGQEVAKPTDVIKDPFVLEFLELRELAGLHERDVEQAIIDRLETFLLELGKGFSFVGRQVRLTVEGDPTNDPHLTV